MQGIVQGEPNVFPEYHRDHLALTCPARVPWMWLHLQTGVIETFGTDFEQLEKLQRWGILRTSLRNISLLTSIFTVIFKQSWASACFYTQTHAHKLVFWFHKILAGCIPSICLSASPLLVPLNESPHLHIKLCFSPNLSVLEVNGYLGTEIKVQFELNLLFFLDFSLV